MRWVVGEFEFDAGNKVLRSSDGDQILEPKAAALLAFFCENPDRDVSREELLEAVWYGQIVSDNSVNRVIVLLRKALHDEDKVRRYIATIPKLGYRFIANVNTLENGVDAAGPPLTTRNPNRTAIAVGTALALALAALVYTVAFNDRPGNGQSSLSVTPLSRLAVTQSNADLGHDGSRLLYSASTENGTAVFMTSQSLPQPIQISAPGGYADFGKWANNDAFAVYLHVNEQKCEFHKLEINGTTPQPPSVLYECVPDSYSEFSFSTDNTKLYFSERVNRFAPYIAYELDLDKGAKRRLSQPVATGIGNHFIDVHPDTGSLLLLSDHAPGKTSVYELDAANDSYSRRKIFDYSLQSAIWSHQAQSIVHPSLHPSYQLLETQLDTGDSRVIVSDSRRISSPRRITDQHDDQKEYLFTSYLFNRDINVPTHPTAQINSAVMDYLPSLSNGGSQLAFVSKRNGYSQILIKDFRDDSLTVIEPRDKGRLFLGLEWSPNDQQIMANTNTGIIVYALQGSVELHDIELTLPAYAASWHGNQALTYSLYEDNHWHAYRIYLETQETISLDKRWAFSLRNENQQIYLDQALTVFRDDTELEPLSACTNPVWRNRLRLVLDGENIYCHANDGYRDLLRFDREMQPTRLRDVVERFEFFSVTNGDFASTSVISTYSDIMQTRSSTAP